MTSRRPEAVATPDRRKVLAGLGAGLAVAARPALAQGAARIVVVGGGFAGTSAARHLKRLDPRFAVTLVSGGREFWACPNSNAVIAGLAPLDGQRFTYDAVSRSGVSVVVERAERVDAARRDVVLASGQRLAYDRLVLAPGIDIDWKALPGYSESAADQMPHGWTGGAHLPLITRQLAALKPGGLVVISMPASPVRCPPAVYERASLMAHYLKRHNPRAKILILDSRDQMPRQAQVTAAWRSLYGSMIERVPLSDGGNVTEVVPATRTFVTDFARHDADLACVIPPQRAASIASLSGIADRTGWCPVIAETFRAELVDHIHVIGDAIIGASLPKSASAAADEGRAVAAIIAASLAGRPTPEPRIVSQCFSLVSPEQAVVIASTSAPVKGQFNDVDPDHDKVPPPVLGTRAEEWFRALGRELWG